MDVLPMEETFCVLQLGFWDEVKIERDEAKDDSGFLVCTNVKRQEWKSSTEMNGMAEW